MAFLKQYQVPARLLGETFTHWGTVHGWVPIYMSNPYVHGACPVVAVRNGFPEFLEPLGRWIYFIGELIATLTLPGFESRGIRLCVYGRVMADGKLERNQKH